MGEFEQQNEARNYPKHGVVNLTSIWRESLLSYPGRSVNKPAALHGSRKLKARGAELSDVTINRDCSVEKQLPLF